MTKLVPKVFNATADFLLHRPAWQVKVGVVLALCLGFVAWLHAHDRAIHQQDASAQAMALALAHEQRAVDTLRIRDIVAIHDSIRVTRTITQLDTLWRTVPETLATHEDTVRALDALPQLRLSTVAATRACTDFQTAFSQDRTACDSALAAKDAKFSILQQRYDAEHPSALKTWTVRVLIGIGAFELGRHLP